MMSLGVAISLGGCVSQASQDALNSYTAQCNAGDRSACVAANNQAAANQQEYQNNANVGYGLLGAFLQGAAQGAAQGLTTPQPVVVQPVYNLHR